MPEGNRPENAVEEVEVRRREEEILSVGRLCDCDFRRVAASSKPNPMNTRLRVYTQAHDFKLTHIFPLSITRAGGLCKKPSQDWGVSFIV